MDADGAALAAGRLAGRPDAGPRRPRRSALPRRVPATGRRERLGIEADEIDGGHMVALSRPRELGSAWRPFGRTRRIAGRERRATAGPSVPAATVVLLGRARRCRDPPDAAAVVDDVRRRRLRFPGGRVDEETPTRRWVVTLRGRRDPRALRGGGRPAGRASRRRQAGRRGRRRAPAGRWSRARRRSRQSKALDLVCATDLLAPISHWTTPPIMPRRFDTRFFVAELPVGAEPPSTPTRSSTTAG